MYVSMNVLIKTLNFFLNIEIRDMIKIIEIIEIYLLELSSPFL